jgi:hypothetical protein
MIGYFNLTGLYKYLSVLTSGAAQHEEAKCLNLELDCSKICILRFRNPETRIALLLDINLLT